MKIELCNEKECTGCSLCANICPQGAIEMRPDNLDNYYPRIDTEKCVACHLCQKSCPSLTSSVKHKIRNAYAAWSTDNATRIRSASGGIASEIYRWCIKNDWSAYGVSYNAQSGARYISVRTETDLQAVQNSKYLSASESLPYGEILDDLDDCCRVLFVGLPCQTAAVKEFVKRKSNHDHKLFTVDLICHGIAPQAYFKQHLAGIPGHGMADRVFFRDPEKRTSKYFLSVYSDSNELYSKSVEEDDLYQLGYHKALIYRENCFFCKYACNNRVGDITLGDFSGLGKVQPVNYQKENVSCVLCNSDSGENLFKMLCNAGQVEADKRPLDEALKFEKQLNSPSTKHRGRDKFVNLYIDTQNFDKAASKVLRSEVIKYRFYKYLGIGNLRSLTRHILSPEIRKKIKGIAKGEVK